MKRIEVCNIKVVGLCAFVTILVGISCTKEDGSASGLGQVKTAYVGLCYGKDEGGVKSSLGTDWKVSWAAGDIITYYTGEYVSGSSTAVSGNGSHIAPSVGTAVEVKVNYLDGDNRVTFLTKGAGIGNVSVSNLETITVTGGVPSSQDGKFASTYIAAAKGNLLGLANSTGNVTMTPLQSYIRFKLDNLVVGGKTVNKIEVTGVTSGGGSGICGNLKLTTAATGTYSWSAALSGTAGAKITLDKTGSSFNVNEYIYVAVLPNQYKSFTLSLKNGDTELATVPVKQGSSVNIDAREGKVVDISKVDEVNDHAQILLADSRMYPDKVWTTKERNTKLVWLKVEPDDFSGTVKWRSSNTDYATVPATGTVVENEPGIGKCIKNTVTRVYNAFTPEASVTIYADIYNPGNSTSTPDETETCVITYGEFFDLGLKSADNKRCLWARQVVQMTKGGTAAAPTYSYSLATHADNYMWPNTTDGRNAAQSFNETAHFAWGEVDSTGISMYPPIKFRWGPESSVYGEFSKYNSTDKLPYLQRKVGEFAGVTGVYNTVDDVATVWNSSCHMPMVSDVSALINECDYDNHKFTSRVPGYTDCCIYVRNGAIESGSTTGRVDAYGFWTAEYDHTYPEDAIFFWGSNYLNNTTKSRRAYVRPVKYVN